MAPDLLVKMLENQGNCCAICARALIESEPEAVDETTIDWKPKPKQKRPTEPHVDFCPETGIVRGLLCSWCLKLLADATDPFELLKKQEHAVPQPKWVNPKPNRPHRKRTRKTHVMQKTYVNKRFSSRECRVRVLAYFEQVLDESLISARWNERRESPRALVPAIEPVSSSTDDDSPE